jgi:diguanylate cyclase
MGLFGKQHNTTEATVAELAQQLATARDKNDFFLITIRALLYFIKEFSLDLTEINAENFKKRLDELSNYLLSESTERKLKAAFEESKELILSYIAKEKDYLNDREKEFKNIITLLTNGMNTLSEENQSFNARIYQRSAKLEEITYLNDIRQIKEELKQEVEQIKHCIRAKQLQDAQRLAALTHEVELLKVDFQKAQQDSLTDGLTGVYNRLAFDTHLSKLIDRNTVTSVPFSLLLLDIDNFKHINDTYGHPVGDRVILAVAQQCKALIRQNDFVARYGGEEFAIMLPGASLRHGLKKARTLCKTIASARYTPEAQTPQLLLSFTVSIGVSAFLSGDTVTSIIKRADKALYEAKRLGKNRAVSAK